MTEHDDKLPKPDVPVSGAAPQQAGWMRSYALGLPARVLRRAGQLGATLLVLLAIYVTAGRLLMPVVAGQAGKIEAQLSQLMGAPVTIGELRGTWFRFSPSLEITSL